MEDVNMKKTEAVKGMLLFMVVLAVLSCQPDYGPWEEYSLSLEADEYGRHGDLLVGGQEIAIQNGEAAVLTPGGAKLYLRGWRLEHQTKIDSIAVEMKYAMGGDLDWIKANEENLPVIELIYYPGENEKIVQVGETQVAFGEGREAKDFTEAVSLAIEKDAREKIMVIDGYWVYWSDAWYPLRDLLGAVLLLFALGTDLDLGGDPAEPVIMTQISPEGNDEVAI